MRYCSNCGSALPEGATVCPNCGTAVPAQAGYAPTYSAAPADPPPGYAAPPPPAYGHPPPAAAGLSINAASALSYLFGFITGIIFLVLEPYKRDRTVRFHAFQSIFLNVAWVLFWIVWGIVSTALIALTHGLFIFVSLLIHLALGLGAVVLWVILMVKAYQGQKLVVPVVGPLAERQAASATF